MTLRLLCFSSSDWSLGDSVGHLPTTSAVLPTPNPKAEKKEFITLIREEKESDTGTSHDSTGAALSPVGPR